MKFEVMQRGARLFYTRGLSKEFGYELQIELDLLSALRCGETMARNVFERIIEELRNNEFLPEVAFEIDFAPRNKPFTAEEIKTYSKYSCILQNIGNFNGENHLKIEMVLIR